MLKIGDFACVKIRGWSKSSQVFVRKYDKNRKVAALLIIDSRNMYYCKEMVANKQDIISIDSVHQAPKDLREWPAEAVNALLLRERFILECHNTGLRKSFLKEKNGYLTPFGVGQRDWTRYWRVLEDLRGQCLNKTQITPIITQALNTRIWFTGYRRLPSDKKLSRKVRKRLRSKQKMRIGNTPRQLAINYIIPDPTIGIKYSPQPQKQKTLYKEFKQHKLWIVKGNNYPHPPNNWPEIGHILGSPEECFAFSGAKSPVNRLRYPIWQKMKGRNNVECSHKEKSLCMCVTARLGRYSRWLNINRGSLAWWVTERQFFHVKYSKGNIKPPDWPETYDGRLGLSQELLALVGASGAEGKNYREWFDENFYRKFQHSGGCRCVICVKMRYIAWETGEY